MEILEKAECVFTLELTRILSDDNLKSGHSGKCFHSVFN